MIGASVNGKHGKAVFLTKFRQRRPGGGRPVKWPDLEKYVHLKVKEAWESGMPICTDQLTVMFQRHVSQLDGEDSELAISLYAKGKKNSVSKFIHRVLDRYNYSIRRNSISKSVPVDWRSKAEDNALRIRTLFKEEKVDVVINADETFVLFHMQTDRLIVPTGIKRVGSAAQVDNDKMGATVLIAAEFRTSMILPPMIIFTGVYGAKLMQQWETFEEGKFFLFSLYYILHFPLGVSHNSLLL